MYVCKSVEELLHHYDRSGLLTMIAQEFIEWDEFIRCLCIGREIVRPIKYDPKARKYHTELDFLPPEVQERVCRDSLPLVNALGHDRNSQRWAVKDSLP